MIKSIAGLARLVATVLAIVAGFVAIPTLNIGLALVVLGIIAGLGYAADRAGRLFLVVLVLPVVGSALATIPAIGAQLNAVAINVALAAAGVAATVIAMRLWDNSRQDVAGLSGMAGGTGAPAKA